MGGAKRDVVALGSVGAKRPGVDAESPAVEKRPDGGTGGGGGGGAELPNMP